MNLRLETDNLRLRISTNELKQLLDCGRVESATPLPGGALHYGIVLADDMHWQLDGNARRLQLTLPRAALLAHQATLPSKAGLAHTLACAGNPLTVHVEIDVKRARPI